MVKTLAFRLIKEGKGQESLDTLGHVQAHSLDNKFSATLAKKKSKTIDGTVRDMEAKALVDRKIDKLLDDICRYIVLCEEKLK